jgi:hypothetical protein
MINEKRLHHVPVLRLPGDGLGKEVGHFLHHGHQASASRTGHNPISDDDHHASFGELADRRQ